MLHILIIMKHIILNCNYAAYAQLNFIDKRALNFLKFNRIQH